MTDEELPSFDYLSSKDGWTMVEGWKPSDIPPEKSECEFFSGVVFRSVHQKPNWWWRMWQYLLLGWRWKDLP